MSVEGKHEGDGVCICRKKLFDVFHRFVTNVEFKFEDCNTCGNQICVFKVLVAQWFDTCCGSKLSKSCQNHSYLLLSKDHRNLNSCNTFNFSIGVKDDKTLYELMVYFDLVEEYIFLLCSGSLASFCVHI
jgi:hypothetical protein